MSMKREAEQAKNKCFHLWHYFAACKWEEARELLSDDFEAFWPQSREHIVGPDNFIELNRRYPGEHKIEVQKGVVEYDEWEKDFTVATHVYIESKMPDGKEMKLYAASFFKVDLDGSIKSATEFWGDIYEAPEWRKDLVKNY